MDDTQEYLAQTFGVSPALWEKARAAEAALSERFAQIDARAERNQFRSNAPPFSSSSVSAFVRMA